MIFRSCTTYHVGKSDFSLFGVDIAEREDEEFYFDELPLIKVMCYPTKEEE